MNEAEEIVLDWADDLDLELQNESYSETLAKWVITRGRVYYADIKSLQRELYDAQFDMGYDEDNAMVIVHPF